MVLTAALLLVAAVALARFRVRLPMRADPPPLGWMSERWIAEQRAAHP